MSQVCQSCHTFLDVKKIEREQKSKQRGQTELKKFVTEGVGTVTKIRQEENKNV
jgi:hypothetical protein